MRQVLGAQLTASKRKELTLHSSSRHQRDLLLMALCAFTSAGWLGAAREGHTPPIARLITSGGAPPEPGASPCKPGASSSSLPAEATRPADLAEGRVKAMIDFTLGGSKQT